MRYWIYHSGKISGPLSVEEILQILPDFGAQSLVCPEKSTGEAEEDWKKAEEVEAFARLLYAHSAAGTRQEPAAPSLPEAPLSETPAPPGAESSFSPPEAPQDSFFMDQFRTALHDLGRKNRDMANAQVKIQSLQQSLHEAQSSIEKHRREVAEAVYSNRQSLLEAQIRLKQKEFALEESRQKIGLLESQVQQMTQLQQEVGSLKEKLSDLLQGLGRKEEHLAKTEEKLASTQENLAKTKVEMEQFKFNLPKITMAPLLAPKIPEAAPPHRIEEEPVAAESRPLETAPESPASREAPLVMPEFPLEQPETTEMPPLEIRQLTPSLEEPAPASEASEETASQQPSEAAQIPAPEMWKPLEEGPASGSKTEEAPQEGLTDIPTLEIHRLEPAQETAPQDQEGARVETASKAPEEAAPSMEPAEPFAEPPVQAPEAGIPPLTPSTPVEEQAPSLEAAAGPEEAVPPPLGFEERSPELPTPKQEVPASKKEPEAEAAPLKRKKAAEKPKNTRRTVIVTLMILFFVGITLAGILFFKNALEMVGRPMMDMSTGMQTSPAETAIPAEQALAEEEIPEEEEPQPEQLPAAPEGGALPMAPQAAPQQPSEVGSQQRLEPTHPGRSRVPQAALPSDNAREAAPQNQEAAAPVEKKPRPAAKTEASKPKKTSVPAKKPAEEEAPVMQPETQADFLPGVPIPYSDTFEEEFTP